MNDDSKTTALIRAGDVDGLRHLLANAPEAADAADAATGVSALALALYHRQLEIADLIKQTRARPLDVFEAAMLGDLPRLRAELLGRPASAADVDAPAAEAVARFSPDGFAPIHLAAFFGRADAVRWLARVAGAHAVRAQNATAVAPLHSAVPTRGDRVRRTDSLKSR